MRLQLHVLTLALLLGSACDKAPTPTSEDASKSATPAQSAEPAAKSDDAPPPVEAGAEAPVEAGADAPAEPVVEAPAVLGPCPAGTMCEDNCSCQCVVDAANRVIRKETDKKKDGSVEEVMVNTYSEQGWLMTSTQDGGIWGEGKVDGEIEQTWTYTYDDQGNRLQHVVTEPNGKVSTTCTYKSCPVPHDTDICYRNLKCKP